MSSIGAEQPHLVCIPFPAQGHITPMMKLAKLLHSRGFFITFVNNHYNQKRLLTSKALSSLRVLPDFRFDSISDSLPPSEEDATQDIPSLCDSIPKHAPKDFMQLLRNLNDPSSGLPPVSGIVADGVMSFTLDTAKELGIPEVILWTTSACGFMAYLHSRQLIERGLFPLNSEEDLVNGFLETPVDWIPGFKNMTMKDLPSFARSTDPNDVMLNYTLREAERTASMAAAVVFNTYDELEAPLLEALRPICPPIYTLGPLLLLSDHDRIKENSVNSNLWKEDRRCVEWLDGRESGSVVYVNFGSITVMTTDQLIEFAWGLANSGQDFLWIIRPDLVKGEAAVLPPEFSEETKERSFMASWCPQEAVLSHPVVGGFLTHSGWNSTIESVANGVPMLCWPFFAEQQTNCGFICKEWGVGMEIDSDVKRGEVEGLIRELMGGEKGEEMKRKALELKESAIRAVKPDGGKSYENLEKLIKEVLLSGK